MKRRNAMGITALAGIGGLLAFLFASRKDQGSPPLKPIGPETSLISIPTPTSPLLLRKAIVANALSVVDTGAIYHRQIFEKLLGPPGPPNFKWDLDRPFRAWKDAEGNYQTQGVSTCGLVAEGIQRRMGSLCSTLYQPYDWKGAKASIARFIQCSLNWGAWRYWADNPPMFELGDYVVIGEGLATHVLTPVGWEDEKRTLISVDGGQVYEGLQSVDVRRRTFSGGDIGGRSIYGYASAPKCKYGPRAIVPKGWKEIQL